ncbi:MAG: 4-hydroxybenzoate 3-monooxygenase [Alphaproteobacteria bacterium]
MKKQRTQVVIVGAGPAGLLLGQLLHNQGIDHIILERQSGDYVLSRIRAGMLETRTVDVLREAGVGDRLDREGMVQTGFNLAGDDVRIRIPFDLVGKTTVVYGQTEITKDLMDARQATGTPVRYEADDVAVHEIDGGQPQVTYRKDGESFEILCDFIAGCDGFHGITRQSVPPEQIKEFQFSYPFGWIGLLADTPPVSNEVVWINHPDGFLMCSLRSHTRSRYYIQVPIEDEVKNWNADRFWTEFERRLPDDLASRLVTGPALEMSIAPLRSFVAEPLRFANLFLVGDAAHVVPPTGAKGLNMAVADAHLLFTALSAYYRTGSTDGLDTYSAAALSRVWKAVRFSWWMTGLMHKFSDDDFARRIQLAEFDYIATSEVARTSIAENFCGLA